MISKMELKPNKLQRVREVARDAGFSINGWGANDRHKNSRWCFGRAEPARSGSSPVPLVFAWWKSLREDPSGNVYFLNDAGDWAAKCRIKGKTAAANKAEEFNNLINACYYGSQPIRVAIVDGDSDPTDDDADEKASKRQLDDALWYPHHIDSATKQVVVMRGVPQPPEFDPSAEYAASISRPISLPTFSDSLPMDARTANNAGAGVDVPSEFQDIQTSSDRVTSSTTSFPRDSEVVKIVKLRAVEGKCECCGRQGFLTSYGGYYLEVHHVIPLSCGGVDAVWNALAICPDEHRQAHFGADRKKLRERMISLLVDRYPQKLEQLLEMAGVMDSIETSDAELEVEFES